MPLQCERRWQRVDSFIEQRHHLFVAAGEHYLTDPNRSPRFNLHTWVGRGDSGTAHISKALTQAFKNTCSIVAPLVLVIVAYKFGDGLPVPAFNCTKQILCVTPHLPLRLP